MDSILGDLSLYNSFDKRHHPSILVTEAFVLLQPLHLLPSRGACGDTKNASCPSLCCDPTHGAAFLAFGRPDVLEDNRAPSQGTQALGQD